MSWLDAIVLGIIQGLTEFIPVSSDGHLSAAEMLMPRFGQVGLLFDVMVHVGTLAAILVYYRVLLARGGRRPRLAPTRSKRRRRLAAGDAAPRGDDPDRASRACS